MRNRFGSNAYKFGLFGANCAGGMTLSAAPERWRADWDEIAEVYRLADEADLNSSCRSPNGADWAARPTCGAGLTKHSPTVPPPAP